jgi:PAS domain-containing protein
MASAALFDLLPDFGSRTSAANQAPAARAAEHMPAAPAPQADIGALIAEAVVEAEAALEARLALAHQAALDAERQASDDAAKAFLESFGGDLGTAVAGRIEAMEQRVAELTGATVARIVGGLLSDDLQERSLQALSRTISAAVADSEAVRIGVRGPLSLFEPLSAALGSRAANLDFTEASGFDLTVTIDETVFETRIAEWSASLSEVLS